MTPKSLLLALASLCLTLPSAVQAAPVTDLPGALLIETPSVNRPNDLGQSAPRAYAPGITWSSDVPSAFGFHRLYGFQDNGAWFNKPMIGLGQASGTMTLSFAAPVAGVGGFFNYAQSLGAPIGDAPTIAIYDAAHHLLDSTVLNFDTGRADLSGYFFGFDVGSALISSFEMSGAYIGMSDLRVLAADTAPAQVPEPATLVLAGGALMVMRGMSRRQRRLPNA